MALFIEAGSMWAIALSLGPKLGEAAALEVTVSAALGSSPTSQPGRTKWDVIADTRDGYKVPRFRNLVVSRSWLAVPRDHSRSRHGNGRAG